MPDEGEELCAGEVAGYVFRLHDQIVDRGFYEDVERHPDRQILAEVACGLEGLGDAYALVANGLECGSIRR